METKKFKKKGGLRYATKNYSNPYFHKKNKSSKLEKFRGLAQFKSRAIIFTGLSFIFFIIGFIMYSPFLKIQNININGEGNVDFESLKNIAWEQANSNFFVFLPQSNLLLFDKDALAHRLGGEHAFSKLSIDKDFRHTININFIEKTTAIYWQEDDKYFTADEYGNIINEISVFDIKPTDFPLIKNDSTAKIQNNLISANNARIKYIIDLFPLVARLQNEFKISSFRLDNNTNAIKITLVDGPELILSINQDMGNQIDKIITIKGNLKDDFAKKVYIDVSVSEAIYIR